MAKENNNKLSLLLTNVKMGIDSNKEINRYSMGNETISFNDAATMKTLDNLDDAIKSNLIAVVSANEDMKSSFQDYKMQIVSNAIKNTYGYGSNSNRFTKFLGDLSSTGIPSDSNTKVVATESINFSNTYLGNHELKEYVNTTIGNEAWDGQKIEESLAYNIALNYTASEQDEFNKAFFPIIPIDAMDAFFKVEANTTFIMGSEDIIRDINGGSSKKKFARKSAIKSALDPNIWSTNRNRLIPVVRTANEDSNFLKEFKRVDKNTGIDIETAPLKIDIEHDLLGISHDDALAAKGNANQTDSIDRDIVIENIYVQVQNQTKDKISIFKFKVRHNRTSRFIMAQQGDREKEMVLNFVSDSLFLDVNKSKDASGNASVVLSDVQNEMANHKLQIALSAGGTVDTEVGSLTVSNLGTGNVIAIYDENGTLVPESDAKYTSIKTKIASISIIGYDLVAYRTNSNLRVNGKILKSDVSKMLYTIPFHTAITIEGPVTNAFGDNNDINRLASSIGIGNLAMRHDGVKQVLDFAETLKSISESTIGEMVPKIDSIAEHYVNLYYKHSNVNLTTLVDSVKSSNRLEDIRAALLNNIIQDSLNMGLDSLYFNAFDSFFPGDNNKVCILVGTDPIIGSYLRGDSAEGEIQVDSNKYLKIVSTPDPRMLGKIFVTFTIFDSNRNKSPHPLSFGWCPWAPASVVDINRTINGATGKTLMSFLRYANLTSLPIMTEYTLTGIQEVLGKVSVYVKHMDEMSKGKTPISTSTPKTLGTTTDADAGKGKK